MRLVSFLYVLMVFLYTGCATERYVSPIIKTMPRTGLTLKTPVLASVYDGRTVGADPGAASILQSQLKQIYTTNMEWIPYFDPIPMGRVSVRLRIVMLGASFGSRLISSASFATAFQSAQASATGPWETVVASSSGSSYVYGGSFSGEGWWNGATWIDIEIQDNRGSTTTRFTIPLAAEHREWNMWGYYSGDKAARKAWENVAAQITRTIDEVLRILRDEGN